MTKTIYTSRTPVQAYQRCKRLRWLSTAEGPEGMGLEPARKSSHLVVGGAVHAGTEVLLREGQTAVDLAAGETIAEKLANVFDALPEGVFAPISRQIEDRAVAAALAEFAASWSDGVELDPEEARQRAAASRQPEMVNDFADLVANPIGGTVAGSGAMGESPIVIEFADFAMTALPPTQTFVDNLLPPAPAPAAYQPFDQDAWLKEEMSALVEGMVRCWARRRWRGIHEQFVVLEVEREGEWKLADIEGNVESARKWHDLNCELRDAYSFDTCPCTYCKTQREWSVELHFLSRHDALLLERSTGYLYLQSFKTTGSWDRRKELDAQVDMQGLSEAVDVERR